MAFDPGESQELEVPTDLITLDSKYWAREVLSAKAVADYADMWLDSREDGEFPFKDKPVLFYDGETYWPGDGVHRITAATKVDEPVIPSVVYNGTADNALLYACSQNATHGVRLTPQDKRHAIETTMRLMPDWGTSEVARHCNVSERYVRTVKNPPPKRKRSETAIPKPRGPAYQPPPALLAEESDEEQDFTDTPAAEPVKAKSGNLDADISSCFGKLVRLCDSRLSATEGSMSRQYHETCIEKLREFSRMFENWKKRVELPD